MAEEVVFAVDLLLILPAHLPITHHRLVAAVRGSVIRALMDRLPETLVVFLLALVEGILVVGKAVNPLLQLLLTISMDFRLTTQEQVAVAVLVAVPANCPVIVNWSVAAEVVAEEVLGTQAQAVTQATQVTLEARATLVQQPRRLHLIANL